jgi:hypothetical protein
MKSTTQHLTEFIAYALHEARELEREGPVKVQHGPALMERIKNEWRNSDELRAAARTSAEGFVALLESAGLGIGIKSDRKLLAALDAIITVPARPAYIMPGSPEL